MNIFYTFQKMTLNFYRFRAFFYKLKTSLGTQTKESIGIDEINNSTCEAVVFL